MPRKMPGLYSQFLRTMRSQSGVHASVLYPHTLLLMSLPCEPHVWSLQTGRLAYGAVMVFQHERLGELASRFVHWNRMLWLYSQWDLHTAGVRTAVWLLFLSSKWDICRKKIPWGQLQTCFSLPSVSHRCSLKATNKGKQQKQTKTQWCKGTVFFSLIYIFYWCVSNSMTMSYILTTVIFPIFLIFYESSLWTYLAAMTFNHERMVEGYLLLSLGNVGNYLKKSRLEKWGICKWSWWIRNRDCCKI